MSEGGAGTINVRFIEVIYSDYTRVPAQREKTANDTSDRADESACEEQTI